MADLTVQIAFFDGGPMSACSRHASWARVREVNGVVTLECGAANDKVGSVLATLTRRGWRTVDSGPFGGRFFPYFSVTAT
jgi:hypothetical protein